MNQNITTMTEKDIITDVLRSEKMLTEGYNTYANECAKQDLRNTMINMLNDVHQMQADVFKVMQDKGWYPTPAADQSKISEAKQKFQNSNPSNQAQ